MAAHKEGAVMYVNRTTCPLDLTPGASVSPGVSGYRRGLSGGCKCGGSCASCGGLRGHRHGMGLFDSADFTTWGLGEWGILAAGAYLVMSLAGDTKRAVRTTRRASRKVYQRVGSMA